MKEISKRGGKRQGAGAKQKYGEPTETVSVRIPVSKVEKIKKMIQEELSINPYQ